ncbi:20S proteasome subunit alpha or beta [Paenibacillus sp. FSL R7-277]|uniref:hypothetical protein n=1 Tax=Paenibacillus sp. FSL R7-277 TaxID=1227352 RepID=UPI0003E20E59|nr:hypothetical protein [Paenibacillus sp. FSL R7-277]ETT77500.1 20S proteasome subunit alpha or beta [Paenibacillus sp. FSL R7-277]
MVSDSHKKLTTLNSHVSLFCSGVQDYCEELRSIVTKQVSELTSIDQIASIVMSESRNVHQRFLIDYPTYYEVNSGAACLATVIAFYDVSKNESGMIEYCHTDNFEPHITIAPMMTARGIAQDIALDYLPKHFDAYKAIESVLDTYMVVINQNNKVGGTIDYHVISKSGAKQYVVDEKA